MASFDMITAVGNAYLTTWNERRYLLRMALVPLLIKYLCYTAFMAYGGEETNIIRQSLFMLPAYFVEGWLIAHWARTIILGHRWPFRPTGNEAQDLASIKERGRGVMSGTIAFTLIGLMMAGYFALFIPHIPMDVDPENADPKIAAIGLFMMVSSVLLFRFVWTYIALAINFPIQDYIRGLMPIKSTFFMLGLWLVCSVPTMVALQIIAGILGNIGGDENTAQMMNALMSFARIALDMIKNLLVTAGMAYAFIEIFKWQDLNKAEK